MIASLLIIQYGTCCTEVSSISEEDLDIKVATNSNPYNKLHFYFETLEHGTIDDSEELEDAVQCVMEHNSDGSTYSSVVRESAVNEIDMIVEFKSDFMNTERYAELMEMRENAKTSEEVLQFRKALNSYSKEYHGQIVNSNLQLLSMLECIEIKTMEYSPFVIVAIDSDNLNTEVLEALCISENVAQISLRYEPEIVQAASKDDTLSGINAYDIVTNGTFTGEGIRIGIYEAAGVCDPSDENLADKNITIKDLNMGIDDHATEVASVLSIIAPDAEFYVSKICDESLSWFVSQNCDIINCSFGVAGNVRNSDGTYSEGTNWGYQYDLDGYYDYMIQAHCITVCVSAGNKCTDNTSSKYNPNNRVTSPGYAYNAITVGGVDRVNISGVYRWIHADGASYACNAPNVKPNVAAPFVVDVPFIGTCGGTSYSSPLVAGCVALIMEGMPQYRLYPEIILSIITATAKKTYDYSATISGFDNKVGAGIIDLKRILSGFGIETQLEQWDVAGEVFSKEIYYSPGSEACISLAWLAAANYTSSSQISTVCTDYEIRLYSSSGTLLAMSNLSDSNVELIRKTVTSAGYYRVVVYRNGSTPPGVEYDRLVLVYD